MIPLAFPVMGAQDIAPALMQVYRHLLNKVFP